MADEKTVLVFVKGKDKTKEIRSWKHESYKPVIWLTYATGKTYPYHNKDVWITNVSNSVGITDQIVLLDNEICAAVESVCFFGQHAKIFYKSGFVKLTPAYKIEIIHSALRDEKSKNCFEYFQKIANSIGIIADNGKNILEGRFDKIKSVRSDGVLADYLKGTLNNTQSRKMQTAIFPFGFNLSQKQAVDIALNNRLSIIEGPPGTGKTQTILNIIANAILRGETVAVVSGNNAATSNIFDKLKKHEIDFLAAFLGNTKNKEEFIDSQSGQLPDLSEWALQEESTQKSTLTLLRNGQALNNFLSIRNRLSELQSENDALDTEYAHFVEWNQQKESISYSVKFPFWISANRILEFSEEIKMCEECGKHLSPFKAFFHYGIRVPQYPLNLLDSVCQISYYKRRKIELRKEIHHLSKCLKSYDFDNKMKEYATESMRIFKANIAEKYKNSAIRKCYSSEDLSLHSEQFCKDYPIILSTTYSLSSSLSSNMFYDYVIVDEASQVDLCTGVLALSCAKKAVIVGDRKQLPNVVTTEQKKTTEHIFSQYLLKDAYNFANHSLLSSLSELFHDIPKTLLREHYRCHPEIIGFCNQKFYNGELIVMTQDKVDDKHDAMEIYKTVKGNHARGHINQRQIDVIKQEVLPKYLPTAKENSIGIVTPYRDQANLLQQIFENTSIKCDTADKFQGQERDTIIFSTVDNKIGDFVSDPNRLNVAVSRAIERFIIVTDGNENDDSSPIHDLIGYIQYQHHEAVESQVTSIFDNLYKCNNNARNAILKKYGRINELESENLMFSVIKDVLLSPSFSAIDVVSHIPLRMLINDYSKLTKDELEYVTNHLTHVDFVIFSKLSHKPLLVIEVDGFAFHNQNELQLIRDARKNAILEKYEMPYLRFNTTGSNEKKILTEKLTALTETH